MAQALRRIFAISDLHLEMRKELPAILWPQADFLVLAGDIGWPNDMLHQFFDHIRPLYKHILYTLGNHEAYNSECRFQSTLDALRQACARHEVHFLHRNSVTIEDVTFHGTTLFSAIDENVPMSDFGRVFHDRIDYLEEFITDFQWLRKTLADKNHEEKHVVITHHLPTRSLIHPRYANSPYNSGFATPILDKLVMRGVQYWFCGHSHSSIMCKYGDTRLILNALGYPHENRMVDLTTFPI